MIRVDLEPFRYCRDAACERVDLHYAHGPMARAFTVERGDSTPRQRSASGVSDALIDTVYQHVGSYVPIGLADLWLAVMNDYGAVTDRSVQRAVSVLLDERAIVGITNGLWSRDVRRSASQSGYYLRYDSPKLWAPGGLTDLMTVVADIADTPAPARSRRRRTVGRQLSL